MHSRKLTNFMRTLAAVLSAAVLTVSITAGAPLSASAAASSASSAPAAARNQDTAAAAAASSAPQSSDKSAASSASGSNDKSEHKAAGASDGTPAGSAWTDSTILGSIQYNTPIRLQDDYYSAVNQAWLTNTPLPSGTGEVSPAADMTVNVMKRKLSLLQDRSLTDHDARITQTLYDILMDWDTRNALGIEPVRPFVNAILSIQSLDQMTAYLCDDSQNLIGNGFTQISISRYISNPQYYAVEIAPTSLLLSDSADYDNISAEGKAELSLAQSKTYYMLERLGFSAKEQEDIFHQCLLFETALAQQMYPNQVKSESGYDTVTANHPCTLEDLRNAAGDYPLIRILQTRGLDQSKVYNLPEPGWLTAMKSLYTPDHLEEMKAYLLVHTVIPAMELTDRQAMNVMIELSNNVSGVSQSVTPEDIAYQYVETLLPEPLDNMYVRAYSSPEEKQQVRDIVDEIIAYYRTMLQNEDWLSDVTKSEAITKLDHLTIRVAYPDRLPDYSGLEITDKDHGGDLIHAFQTIHTFQQRQTAALVNQKLDDSHWAMPASTVNCFYNAEDNSINILAGMLEAPFYEEGMSREEMLAGIGFVIGHEISHAFDSDGAQYDESGNPKDWWAPQDKAAYEIRRAALIHYYNGFVPAKGFGHVKGKNIADEAIADLGGMKCMLGIAAQDPAFDYDAFFRHFAADWAGVRNEFTELTYLHQDSHPLYYLRVNVTLQQFEPFYQTYHIQKGDGMWLAPDKRIGIW